MQKGIWGMNSGDCSSLDYLNCKELLPPNSQSSSHWYKPVVTRGKDLSGVERIFKKYPAARFPIRYYFLALANHEYKMLKRVEGLDFAPRQVGRGTHGTNEISYQYIDGRSIKHVSKHSGVPEGFFPKLYTAVLALHLQGTAHLDLGNSGNVLVSKAGEPIIIDFGSAFALERIPAFLQRWMRKKDLLGVLKLWQRFDRETIPVFLLEYYQRNYKKNIYTPRRFYKAAKRVLAPGRNRTVGDDLDNAGIVRIVGLFFGLMILISLW